MKVYALVGSSGTGKSYNAMKVAYEYDIHFLIDDGLLISRNKKLAGKSAKRETTKIGAVKRALFLDEQHRDEVKSAIDESHVDKILILGTSDRMVIRIADNLGLGEIDQFVYIDDIATKEEISIARYHRMTHGKHIIPLPTLEVKKDFSGYFFDNIRAFRKHRDKHEMEYEEKTVVRPTFSYMGKYTISNKTILEIVRHGTSKIEHVHSVGKVRVNMEDDLEINIEVSLIYGCKVNEVARQIQEDIKRDVEYMTHLNIGEVNVIVKSLSYFIK